MNIFKMLLSITLLIPTLVFAQGGNDPVEGIDIIVKSVIMSETVELNERQLKRVSALKDESRSYYLSEVIAPMLNKAMGGKYNEKELQNILLKQLLANRCNPCKAFETFSYKAQDSRTKETYSVTFNLHTQVDIAKPQRKVAEMSASRELKVKAVPDAIKPK
nr:hypothetical protein [uncultured Amphritea sp.]